MTMSAKSSRAYGETVERNRVIVNGNGEASGNKFSMTYDIRILINFGSCTLELSRCMVLTSRTLDLRVPSGYTSINHWEAMLRLTGLQEFCVTVPVNFTFIQ